MWWKSWSFIIISIEKQIDMQKAWSFISLSFQSWFLLCLFYCLMCLLCLHYSFLHKALRSQERKQKDKKHKKRYIWNMRARNSHYNSQKIKKLSELLKYHALLKNILLFYFIINLIYRKHYFQYVFLYTRFWWFNFEYYTR